MIKLFFQRLSIVLISINFLNCEQQGNDVTDLLQFNIAQSEWEGKPALNIKMKFKTDSSGTTRILYENEAWGQENLFDCIKNIKLLDSSIVPEINRDSGWIEIQHPRDLNLINFQYTLIQDFDGEGGSRESYRPLIQQQFFHVFSHNMFMIPKHIADTPEDTLNVEINWDEFPEHYKIHNSFATSNSRQLLTNISLGDFHSAIFVGGDFRIYKQAIEGNAIYLASRGDWIPFKDSTVMQVLSKTIKLQRDFWQDHSQDYFTVTLRPITQDKGSSFQGTGLTNSFATTISNNEYTDIGQLVYLFNHELQHNWIGHTIKNANEEQQYWFSEGFTEYYTLKNIAKHQIQGLDGAYFIKEINGIIRNLYSSPVKEAPNSDINYENFWSDRHYSKLPYYRGALIAFYLDKFISLESKGRFSLDDVMHDLQKGALENDLKINQEYFVSVVNQYVNEDIKGFAKDHIEGGKLLPLEDIFKTFGWSYMAIPEIFDLGFKFSDDQNFALTVDETSAAFASGLRAGDQLTSRSIYFGNIERQVVLTVKRGDEYIDINYYPVKKAEVPQIEVSETNIGLLTF
ncbi:M1 family aminopeptidase [Muriicola sp. Z0-33]|uniref:M1 family aminopeptidase n=1 Tax=Muriicola sp. Z0-33 TaxID=2816957 RepID=UPI0022375782|nr:M1 family aminopeptidase [Muriicola sp. Z0-33]MCW5517921.1 hypothetical protein [Muriicola sp. Z0-33]